MPTPNPEEHKRIVNDALKTMTKLTPSKEDDLVNKLETISIRIHKDLAHEVLMAGFIKDRSLLAQKAAVRYAEELRSFDNDEVRYLLCGFLGGKMLEVLERL